MSIYLKSFTFPSAFLENKTMAESECFTMTCYPSFYPFGILAYRGKSIRRNLQLDFAPITIFYGNNGSGKSTAINIISEKLGLLRESEFNKTDFFPEYLQLCQAETWNWNSRNRVITSDDIFNYILYLRKTNEAIDREHATIMSEIMRIKGARNHPAMNEAIKEEFRLKGLEDIEKLRHYNEYTKKSASQLIRERVGTNRKTQSNGESSQAFFSERIKRNALYILDEPENSLSVQSQMVLYDFLVEATEAYNCQLIIATHSPILLALPGAKIYNFDTSPMTCSTWQELESVKSVFNFFNERKELFEEFDE